MKSALLALAFVAVANTSPALAQDTSPAPVKETSPAPAKDAPPAPAKDKPAAPAKEAPLVDPLAPIKDDMAEQDRLADAGKADDALAAARKRAADGTPESLYLLGRALGNVAVKRLDARREGDALRLLDEAATAFDKSQEAGGLTYAPAHLGRARVSKFRFSITSRRIDQMDPKDRKPFIEQATHDLDEAIKEYRAALQVAKVWKEAVLELAITLRQRELRGDAEFVLYQFLSARPRDPDARIMLGMLKMERSRYAEAEPEFRSVLAVDAENLAARKCLAQTLLSQDKFAESAEHWEIVRKQSPKDDESYIKLFHLYKELDKKDEALAVLNDAVLLMPGTEAARRSKLILDELAKDPSAWDASDQDDTPESLVKRLDSADATMVRRSLEKMRSFKWPELPRAVYHLLLRQDDKGSETLAKTFAAQRLAAVRLILDLGEPQTLTILEILLAHPEERELDPAVREEVAHAISRLPTDAIVPILFDALGETDPDIREWAVQGIAARTGKYFRPDLAVRATDKDWPDELASLRKWWASSSSSEAKRAACAAFLAIYGRVEQGSKSRVARYALPALDDASEVTWCAGYELFRALTAETLGRTSKPATAEERQKFAADARAWLDAHAKGSR